MYPSAASFETAPLADDTRIAVIGPDGRVLARYPALSGQPDIVIGEGELRTIFAAGGKATLRESSSDQEWRIEAIRPLTGYPLAIAVSRGASAALADWRRQMWIVGFFAIEKNEYRAAHSDMVAMHQDFRWKAEAIDEYPLDAP